MSFFDDIMDEDDEKEIEEQIRLQVKTTIKTLEIFWEELQKSSLPEEIKIKMITNYNSKN